MASQNASYDMADTDGLLASMTPNSQNQADNDMIPLQTKQPQIPEYSEDISSDSSTSPSRKPSMPRSRAKKQRKAAHQNQQSKPLLRPAKDILSRIRHDASLDEAEFVVGYHDRHAPDVIEMDVSAWKGGGDFTDEEWIPQHRILYFRKKDDVDGRKVWDRATRLDRLFGSGVVVADQPEKDDKEVGSGVQSGASSQEREEITGSSKDEIENDGKSMLNDGKHDEDSQIMNHVEA